MTSKAPNKCLILSFLASLLFGLGLVCAARRGALSVSTTIGRVQSLSAALESFADPGKPKEARGLLTGLPRSTPGFRWWDDEVMLTRSLQDAEARYLDNLKLRASSDALLRFVRNKGSPGWNMMNLDGLLIPTWQCPAEYRLGSWADGGKWVCMSHYQNPLKNAQPKQPKQASTPVVVSVGCNGETSFESAVYKETGAVSQVFDFSLSPEVTKQVKMFNFIDLYEAGLVGSEKMEEFKTRSRKIQWLTIFELLSRVKAKYVDILKLDCEGCEYWVVDDLARGYSRETVPFGQIQVEVHLPGDRLPGVIKLLTQLEDLGFRLFHSEINRFTDKGGLFHYELAFIHESIVLPAL